jgi:hypothetical protein
MGVQIRGGLPANAVVTGAGTDPPAAGDIGKVDRTGQVANITAQNITSGRPAGVYTLSGALECTVAGSATISLNETHSGDAGSATSVLATKSMVSTGNALFNVSLYLASGDITWTVTGYTAGTFAVRMRCTYEG